MTGVTTTRKFNWTVPDEFGEPQTKIYYPGKLIEEDDAAVWALDHLHGEERGEQSPGRNLAAPENKARSLEDEGGENKTEANPAEIFDPQARRKSPEEAEAMRVAREAKPEEGGRQRRKRGGTDELELTKKA